MEPMCILYPIFILVAGGLAAIWIWMIIDCATKEPAEGNERLIWILVICLAGWIGALIYLFVRRPRRIELHGR
jgi:hypothetical protein